MTKIRRLAATLAFALLLPAVLLADNYIIYTKDGQRIPARDKPVVQGNRLIFRTPLGAEQSLSIADYDEVRTLKANQEGLGGAYVLGETGNTKVIPDNSGKKPSLSEYIRENKKIMKPATPEGGGSEAGSADVGARLSGALRTAEPGGGGGVDLQMMNSFVQSFERAGLRGVRLISIPQGVRLQVITETEQQVFAAISAAARGLKESRAFGKPLDKVDMFLATSAGEPAGHFLLSPEDAEALVTGRTTPSKFFVQSVQF
ncbi:MAG: hypothetical protein ACM3JH_08240 [Acidithiobacillales bacterium]